MENFITLFIVAVVIKFIPVVRIPFKMLSTYFHELGHGLIAIITGGKIERIVLNFDGSGFCEYRYRSNFLRFFVTISGYITTSVVGYFIYRTALLNEELITDETLYIILSFLLISIILWIRDIKTIFLTLTIAFIFALPLLHEFIDNDTFAYYTMHYFNSYIKLIGIYVMIDGLISPFHLIDGGDDGDGGTLQNLTGIPEGFWIALWISIAGYFLYLAYLL
jgi:hypothetical protein